MRDFWDWIVDHAGTIVPVLGGAAVILCGGAISAACAGYYVAAGVAGGLGLASGVGAGQIRIVNQNRLIEELSTLNNTQAVQIQSLESIHFDERNTNLTLLNENKGQEQTIMAQKLQIAQLTQDKDRLGVQIETLLIERNQLRQKATDSLELRRNSEALRLAQNTQNRLNTRIEELERQNRIPPVAPTREDIKVSPIAAGTFGPRPVQRRTRIDDERVPSLAYR